MRTVIKNCNIIDGIQNNPIRNAHIFIKDDEIENVTVGNLENVRDDDLILNCTGKYVIPGLIDCHVHLVCDGGKDPQSMIMASDDEMVTLHAYKSALDTLRLGITTVRDLASPGRTIINLRDAINDNVLVGPTILASGPAVCMTGGHVHYLGIEADGSAEVRKATRKVLKDGADFVKVMATGGIATHGETPGSSQLTVEELSAAKEEAHKKNKMIAAHAQGLEGIMNCIDIGIDTIEHGIYADEQALYLMKEKGIFLVPTIIVMQRLATSEAVPKWLREKAEAVVEPHQKMLEMAIKIGVKIATGTDCGSPVTPPEYYFDELTIMEDAGMTPMEVIKSSTKIAAECLGLKDRGTITNGQKADLLILNENPLENLHTLKNRNQVIKNGKFVQ
ncbi:amidohydrolase family protein [Ornithinibacillus sp. 4-3]|uniref:Amidohydrolase family protein n=1 Tax=Ornithinibacillus sp. 4-3 TaxID=3231488 RepID=A0AB39HPQ4_9BACI